MFVFFSVERARLHGYPWESKKSVDDLWQGSPTASGLFVKRKRWNKVLQKIG